MILTYHDDKVCKLKLPQSLNGNIAFLLNIRRNGSPLHQAAGFGQKRHQ